MHHLNLCSSGGSLSACCKAEAETGIVIFLKSRDACHLHKGNGEKNRPTLKPATYIATAETEKNSKNVSAFCCEVCGR